MIVAAIAINAALLTERGRHAGIPIADPTTPDGAAGTLAAAPERSGPARIKITPSTIPRER